MLEDCTVMTHIFLKLFLSLSIPIMKLFLVFLPILLARPPIERFLTDLGLGQYVDVFLEEEITLPILTQMTEEQLCRIGMTRFGQRFWILEVAKKLDIDIPHVLGSPYWEVRFI